jgi:hypothetical protein
MVSVWANVSSEPMLADGLMGTTASNWSIAEFRTDTFVGCPGIDLRGQWHWLLPSEMAVLELDDRALCLQQSGSESRALGLATEAERDIQQVTCFE